MDTWIGLAVIAVIVIYVISLYNGFVALKNRLDNAWAQIDVQLQRRYDLIPNLVETARGYMQHEREALTQVIDARNQACDQAKRTAANPSNANAVRQLSQAEAALSASLMNFNALSEAYPDLKADGLIANLQEELSHTENTLGFARQAFNDAVMRLNTRIQSFPNNLFAPTFGFRKAEHWQVDTPDARQAVTVSLS